MSSSNTEVPASFEMGFLRSRQWFMVVSLALVTLTVFSPRAFSWPTDPTNPLSITSAPGKQWEPKAATDGTDFLIIWIDSRKDHADVMGQIMSSDGNPLGSEFQIADEVDPFTSSASVSYDGANYLVIWIDDRNGPPNIYGQFVAPDGLLVGGNFPVFSTSSTSHFPADPVMAFESDPAEAHFYQKCMYSREAAVGGIGGGAGGGCGCY